MPRYFILSLLLSVMVLSACGTRGSLYLPPQQKAPAPIATTTSDPSDS
ncbi:MAG: lipoprotein [Candidatus Accumulibacter sp.]|nr:lipoprotein [Accumulibacter sp.]